MNNALRFLKLHERSLRHSVSACSRKTLTLYSSSYVSTGGQRRIHSTSGQHHTHQAMRQPVVSTAFIQPAVSTTFIQLCVNWRSAPQSFNRQSAPHSSSGQLPSVCHAGRTSHLQQFTAELSPKHTGSIVNEHNLPVVLSSSADSSTSHTHTPQPANHTQRHAVSPSPHSSTS